MLVRVATLYEDEGRPLPRNREITQQPTHEGVLSLSEAHGRAFRRSIRTARLTVRGIDVIPPLRDAVVLFIRDGLMTIRGFEQSEMSRRCAGQTWLVEMPTGSDGADLSPS